MAEELLPVGNAKRDHRDLPLHTEADREHRPHPDRWFGRPATGTPFPGEIR